MTDTTSVDMAGAAGFVLKQIRGHHIGE